MLKNRECSFDKRSITYHFALVHRRNFVKVTTVSDSPRRINALPQYFVLKSLDKVDIASFGTGSKVGNCIPTSQYFFINQQFIICTWREMNIIRSSSTFFCVAKALFLPFLLYMNFQCRSAFKVTPKYLAEVVYGIWLSLILIGWFCI